MSHSYDFSKFRRAVVMGYSIRLIYGIYIAIKRRHFQESSMIGLSSKMKNIFWSMDHYRFSKIFFNVAMSYYILGRLYDRYVIVKERKMDTKISKNYAKRKKKLKIFSNVIFSMISCLWFKKLPKKFRHFLVLHLLVRSGYDLIKLLKYDNDYKVIPNIAYDEIWILSIILCIIAVAMCHYPSIIDGGYYKFLLKWGNNTAKQLKIMFQTPNTFTPCSPTWHKEPSCLKHYSKGFFIDIFKASQMYAIVHLLPLFIQSRFYKLIYRFIKSLIIKPVNDDDNDDNDQNNNDKSPKMELLKLMIKKFVSILRSSMFFSGFQHFGKLLMCWMRYYVLKSDPIYNTVGCVFIGSSIAQLFETSKRRIQYTLYLSPEILKMISNALHNKYGNIPIKKIYKWWDILVIQISFAIWSFLVSINKSDEICGTLTNSLLLKTFL